MSMKRRQETDQCLLLGQRPLCQILADAHLPNDPKWISLVLYMRSLEYNDALGLSQRASLQKLLLTTLKDGDFSDRKYHTIMRMQERVVSAPYRRRLEAAEAETRALLDEFEATCSRHTGKVRDLGESTQGLVKSGAEPADMVRRLRKSFGQLVRAMEEDARTLEMAANTDPLTGLANRRRMDAELMRATTRAALSGDALSLVLLDVDDFRAVNDAYGHETGDRVLRMVASLLSSEVDQAAVDESVCARFGDDTFGILLYGMDLEAARTLAEHLRRTVAQGRLQPNDHDPDPAGVGVTVTVGAALLDVSLGDVMAQSLVEAAQTELDKSRLDG